MKLKQIIYATLLLSIFIACNSSGTANEITIPTIENKSNKTPTHKVTILKDDKPFMQFESPYSEFLLIDGNFNMSLYEKENSKLDARSILLSAKNIKVGTFAIESSGLRMQEGQPRIVIDEQKNGIATNIPYLITASTVTITSYDGKSISGTIKGTGNWMSDNSKLSIDASFNDV